MKPTSTATVAAGTAAIWSMRHQRSAAVKSWSPSTLPGVKSGRLFARAAGGGNAAVILLHGLISTGDIFGARFDPVAFDARLVIPDLAGFGRSLDESRVEFSIDHHLDSLDELAARQGLFESRWILGAHSMGSAVALQWALRHHQRVDRIVCWGAPIYRSPDQARASIAGIAMARLFALDTRLAERACSLSCRHRTAAGYLAAAAAPALPTPIARAAPLHTWPAYRDAVRHFVIEPQWHDLLSQLDATEIDTALIWGTHDPTGDQEYCRELADSQRRTTVTYVERADHHLPISHPDLCVQHLDY